MLYAPPYFKEERPDVLRAAIRNMALATLVTQGADGILANHLPLLLDGDILSGHFARANPVWKSLEEGAGALAIFLGPHFHTSPSWYPSKAETGKGVPTWNYITVHVRGTVTLHEDEAWLTAHLAKLSDAHEAHRPNPWKPEDAPADYIAALKRAIVGFEIAISSIEGKWKLSQNRVPADIQGVRDGLIGEGRADLANLIPK
jgi:transcriptional regulator